MLPFFLFFLFFLVGADENCVAFEKLDEFDIVVGNEIGRVDKLYPSYTVSLELKVLDHNISKQRNIFRGVHEFLFTKPVCF